MKNIQFCSRSSLRPGGSTPQRASGPEGLSETESYAPEGKTKISTTGILEVFRGIKFESDAEIGQKRAFSKGLQATTEEDGRFEGHS